MSSAPSIIIMPWIAAAMACVILALAVWRRRPAHGARSFVANMAILGWLAFCEGIIQSSSDLSTKIFWSKASYLSLATLPVAWLGFVLRYTDERSLTAREFALLSVEPLITLLVAWTNEGHGWLWRSMQLDVSTVPPGLRTEYGPWLWVHSAYSGLVGGYATLLFVQARKQLARLQRRQATLTLLAMLAPALASAVYVMAPAAGHSVLAGTLLLSCALLAWALLRLGMFELRPVALQAVVAQMQDGVIVLDTLGRIVDHNPAARQILGANARLALGQPAAKCLLVVPGLAAHAMGDEPLQEELQVSPSGEERHLKVRSSPLGDDLGQVIGRLIVLQDVTAVSAAGKALAESEEKYRLLVERANDGIAIILDGIVVYGNPRLFEILGHAPEEMLGRPVNDFIWHENREAVMERYRRRLAGEVVPPIYETALCHRSGEKLPVELNAGLMIYQGQQADLVLVRDISERLRTRQQLTENARQLERELSERQIAEQTSRRRAEELAALQNTVLDITAPNELPQLLERIVERATQLLDTPSGGLYLCDHETRTVRCVVSHNTPQDYRGTELRYGEGAAGVVAETGQPLIIDDYRAWVDRARAYEHDRPFTAVLSAPMIWQGEVTGVIHVLDNSEERRFTPDELELLRLFASHAAIAVENARLREAARAELAERTKLQTFSEGIVNGMTEGLLVEDAEGVITFVNPALARLLGYEREELLGHHWTRIVPAGEIERIAQRMAQRPLGETDQYESALSASDGRLIPMLIGARPLFDGEKFSGMLSAFTDITERKRLEAETERRRLYLERVLASAPDAIITQDRFGRVVDWNQGAERLFGYSPAQARGQDIDELVARPDPAVFEEAISLSQQLRSGLEVPPMETVRYRQDGSPVHVIVAAAPIEVDQQLTGMVGVYTDLSVLKRLQDESEERRLYLESVLTSAPDGIVTLDRQHRIVDWNEGAERIFGYSAAEARGHDIDELVSNGQAQIRAQAISFSEEVFGGGARPPTEVVRYRRDGTLVNLITAASRIMVGGELRGAVVVYSDITELKQAEAELRQSEARYRAVVEDQTEMVSRFQPDGTLTFVNEATCRFVGKTRDQLLGRTIYQDMSPEDAQKVRQSLSTLGADQPVLEILNRVVTADGETRWVQWTDRGIHDADGQIVEVQSVGRDITEQRLAQEQLREAELKYRTLVETSPDGITVTDLQGMVTLCNPQAAVMHGYDGPEQMVGLQALALIAPQDHQRAARNLERTLREGSLHNVDYTSVRQDGTSFPAELSTSVIRDAASAPVALITVTRDTTERQRAQAELEASLQEKDLLLREVHHRVKNNLQVISSLLYLQASKADSSEGAEMFRSSRNQIHSMALVHEKLYGSGDLARVDFDGYVQSLTSSLLQSYGAADGEIELDVDVQQIELNLDLAIPCGLIINELVTNALRHAFRPGERGCIAVRFSRENGLYRLKIADDGVGLPPGADDANRPSLGLQLVSTLVDQLEGSLDIVRDSGTSFTVSFPATNGRAKPDQVVISEVPAEAPPASTGAQSSVG